METLRIHLREWDDQIDALWKLAKLARLETQTEFHAQMVQVLNKRDALQEKAEELQGASQDAWEVVRENVEGAHSELRAAYDDGKRVSYGLVTYMMPQSLQKVASVAQAVLDGCAAR